MCGSTLRSKIICLDVTPISINYHVKYVSLHTYFFYIQRNSSTIQFQVLIAMLSHNSTVLSDTFLYPEHGSCQSVNMFTSQLMGRQKTDFHQFIENIELHVENLNITFN